jgi:hypothetical protein
MVAEVIRRYVVHRLSEGLESNICSFERVEGGAQTANTAEGKCGLSKISQVAHRIELWRRRNPSPKVMVMDLNGLKGTL